MKRIVLTLLIWLMLPGVALAQDSVAHLFPDGEEIGEGWSQVSFRGATGELDPSIADMARAIYVGPGGERSLILVYKNAPGQSIIRNSADTFNTIFESFNYVIGGSQQSLTAFDSRTPPRGCDDARRLSGEDDLFPDEFPIGITMCAAGSEYVIFAVVSGYIGPLGGVNASDHLVAFMLDQTSGTPVP